MREIKFRVWHPPITDGEHTLPGYMDYDLIQQNVIAMRTETRTFPDNLDFEHYKSGLTWINRALADYGDRLMQFTGLQDNNGNGKEIWEGDIVRAAEPNRISGVQHTYVVKWEQEYAGFYPFIDCDYGATSYYQYPLIVIGNIYENPELLNT